jgi:predicted metal-dependent hydrolase
MSTAPHKVAADNSRWHDAEELKWAARHWAVRMSVKMPQIHVRRMRSKWASMSTGGRLTLNADLIALPKDLGDYVIVHELVHLLAPSHGKLFKSFMFAYMPDWEERERVLRLHGRELQNPLS